MNLPTLGLGPLSRLARHVVSRRPRQGRTHPEHVIDRLADACGSGPMLEQLEQRMLLSVGTSPEIAAYLLNVPTFASHASSYNIQARVRNDSTTEASASISVALCLTGGHFTAVDVGQFSNLLTDVRAYDANGQLVPVNGATTIVLDRGVGVAPGTGLLSGNIGFVVDSTSGAATIAYNAWAQDIDDTIVNPSNGQSGRLVVREPFDVPYDAGPFTSHDYSMYRELMLPAAAQHSIEVAERTGEQWAAFRAGDSSNLATIVYYNGIFSPTGSRVINLDTGLPELMADSNSPSFLLPSLAFQAGNGDWYQFSRHLSDQAKAFYYSAEQARSAATIYQTSAWLAGGNGVVQIALGIAAGYYASMTGILYHGVLLSGNDVLDAFNAVLPRITARIAAGVSPDTMSQVAWQSYYAGVYASQAASYADLTSLAYLNLLSADSTATTSLFTTPQSPQYQYLSSLTQSLSCVDTISKLLHVNDDEFSFIQAGAASALSQWGSDASTMRTAASQLGSAYRSPVVGLQVNLDRSTYTGGQSANITAEVVDESGAPLAGLPPTYLVRDSSGTVKARGTLGLSGVGQWAAILAVNSLSGTGSFSIEVTASALHYLDTTVTVNLSVSGAPQVGHDVGVTGVSWDSSSAINALMGDMQLSPGQSIVLNAIRVKDFGDYAETSFPIFMELSQVSGGQTKSSNTRYFSLDAHQEALCQQGLVIDTSGMTEGVYKLSVRTNLSGDANSANDALSWQIVLGNPGPQPGQLPYASYDWYQASYTGTSSQTAVETITGYSLKATYFAENQVQLWSGSNLLGVLHAGDPPTAFNNGDLIAWCQGAAKLQYPGETDYFLDVQAGVRSSFSQDRPMQTIYGWPGPGTVNYTQIDSRYVARFDYYLPSYGATSNELYLVGWGPQIAYSQWEGYRYQWTTTDSPGSYAGADGKYGGSLRMTDSRGAGTINDYYVFVPRTNMPEGDYNLLIIQNTNQGGTNQWWREGVAHSVRVTVDYYRDLAASAVIVSPSTPTVGDSVGLQVTVSNSGDVAVTNVPVSVSIVGTGGYNVVLNGTASNVPWQGQQVVTFNWNTAGLASGNYTATAYVMLADDQNTSNQSVSVPISLQPPAPPPALQSQVTLGKTVYNQGESVGVDVLIKNAQGQAIDAALYWELKRGGQVVKSATATVMGGTWHADDIGVPGTVGGYDLRIVASRVGFSDGQATVSLTVRDSIAPTDPVPVYPAAGQIIAVGKPQLDWLSSLDASTGVQGYELLLDGATYQVAGTTFTPSMALSEGIHKWQLRVRDGSSPVNWSGWTVERDFIIDLTPPRVTTALLGSGDNQRSRVSSLGIELGETLASAPAKSILALRNISTGTDVDLGAVAFVYDPTTRTATWNFAALPGGSLPDGNYRATISSTGIADAAGNLLDGNGDGIGGDEYAFDLFRFFGDADGDRDVDPVDLFKFKKTYMKDSSDPLFDSRMDSDGDGDVDPVDLFKFKQNYLKTLDAPFQLVVAGAPVTVPEGSSAGFTVALSGTPSAPITVTVARTSGDTDLTVSSGASLVFNSTNWNQPQTVTITAAEDADTINGTAQFALTAPNVIFQAVTANEQDNDLNSSWVQTSNLRGTNPPGLGTVVGMMQASDGSVYATIYDSTAPGEIFRTADGGATWTPAGVLPDVWSVGKIIQASDGAILVGTGRGPGNPYPGRIYRSTDSGQHWSEVLKANNSQEFINSLFQASDGYLYAGTATATSSPVAGVYRSSDGITWTAVGAPPVPQITDFIEDSSHALYLATVGSFSPGQIYKSTDHGQTWGLQTTFAGTWGIDVLRRTSDGRLWAAGVKAGPSPAVFWSSDDGASWHDVSNLLAPGTGQVSDLVECPDGFLYAATYASTGQGEGMVYRTKDLGQTWEKVTNWPSVNGAASLVLASGNCLYAGTGPHEAVLKLFVGLRDDFSSTTPNAALDPTKWTIFTDTGTWGPKGGSVTQTGDGWAHVAVASQHTGTGFYTTQTFANVGQYHIEGKVKFTRGTNNADNIFVSIRNPDESLRVVDPYEEYQGPQIRIKIHPTHSPMQGGFTSVYSQTKNSIGYQLPQSTSNDISWSGTNTVVMSIDFNADTGQVDFKLYNEDKTQVRTQGTFTLDAQTRADIGANFRVEMGMDGYNSYDHYWDYVEVRRLAP